MAKKLGLTSGRIANILAALKKKKYIKRERDTVDKRKTFVLLTELGEKYIKKIIEQQNQMYLHIVENISEQDIQEYIRITEKVFQGIKELEMKERINLRNI